MEYPILKTGDIVLYRNKSVLAWLIRLFTGMRYNHAGIIVGTYLFESLDKGIVKSPLFDNLNGQEVLIKRFELSSQFHPEHIESVALHSEGVVKYDFKNLLFNQLIYRLTGLWVGKASTNAMICTEFVARCYSPHYEFGPDLEKISPKEIILNPDFFTIFKGKYEIK
jgi:hypothetical protein